MAVPDLLAPHYRAASGQELLGRCLVAATLAAMKRLIYYSSITQRERSYFRQLNF